MKKSAKLNRANIIFGIGVALVGMGAVVRLLAHRLSAGLNTHTDNPASTYDMALAGLARLQAQDDEKINPLCCTQLLSHGSKM